LIKAILFDLDETLIDRSEMMRQFLLEQHQRFSVLHSIDKASFVEACIRHQNNGYANKKKAYISALNEISFPDIPVVELLLEDLYTHYGKFPVLFEGVHQVLQTLSLQFHLGVVSNGRTSVQLAKLENSGIAKYFSSICISESIGCKKPDPIIFQTCLHQLSVAPEEAVFVGDNPCSDIEPAIALGMRAIWVENDNFDQPEDDVKAVVGLNDVHSILAGFIST